MSTKIDFASPKNSPNYEQWKKAGIARAAQLASLYDDKVTIHWNESPSEANFFITIGVDLEGDVIRLLDFAKENRII